jgi:hypothetical protein
VEIIYARTLNALWALLIKIRIKCHDNKMKKGGQQGALCSAGRPNLQTRLFTPYRFRLNSESICAVAPLQYSAAVVASIFRSGQLKTDQTYPAQFRV